MGLVHGIRDNKYLEKSREGYGGEIKGFLLCGFRGRRTKYYRVYSDIKS